MLLYAQEGCEYFEPNCRLIGLAILSKLFEYSITAHQFFTLFRLYMPNISMNVIILCFYMHMKVASTLSSSTA